MARNLRLGLGPASLSTNLDTSEVYLSLVCVLPGLGPGGLSSDVGSNGRSIGVVTVGDRSSELEPFTTVGKVALMNAVNSSTGMSGRKLLPVSQRYRRRHRQLDGLDNDPTQRDLVGRRSFAPGALKELRVR